MSASAGSNKSHEGWRGVIERNFEGYKGDLQKAPGEHQIWRNKYVVEVVKPYCLGCHQASPVVREWEHTFHAIFRSATNLSENDLSFKWTKDDETKFD